MPHPRPGRPEAAAAIWDGHASASRRAALPSAGSLRLRGSLQALAGMSVGVVFLLFLSRLVGTLVLGIGSLVLLSALLSPRGVYAGIDGVFDRVAKTLGRAMTWLLLVPLFYLFFFPFGALLRRGKRDRLQRRFEAEAESYWEAREGARAGSGSRLKQY